MAPQREPRDFKRSLVVKFVGILAAVIAATLGISTPIQSANRVLRLVLSVSIEGLG
jgi:hypothetical protein